MKVESVKLILDVCAEAAHIEQLLPELPQGITPRCVRVIEQIAKLSKEHRDVRVSDISEMLDVTRPGITAVLRELTEMGYVTKSRDDVDSRVVYVALTEKGWALYRRVVEDYHQHLFPITLGHRHQAATSSISITGLATNTPLIISKKLIGIFTMKGFPLRIYTEKSFFWNSYYFSELWIFHGVMRNNSQILCC